ncbi:hypothetical protein QBC33DRAFT_614681 [Phialemonium atrogriseum]|uniref:AB hydrolase-1 domain-containing protein n=1 Tax=Phialemonium atrogriseum TaxID=1093897 RepID=A0AAJ0FI44_9PEZI|nr:uncharacterized protein QBC33DRAFT_614681 [Phialemonium atrogriseum]KAK1761745.1 hypothetical protein QBC33DRAFT_614681 [Phialemonium atrogriseum]
MSPKPTLRCIAVELPTTQSNRAANFSNDVRAGRDVVVVVHSYGGAVGLSGIRGLTRPKGPPEASSSGHVIGIVVMATGFMPTGVGFLEGFGGKPPPIWKLDEERGLAVITVDQRELLYHDLPKEEGDDWGSKPGDQSLQAFTDGTNAYAMAKDAGADVTVRGIDSSHSPMLSNGVAKPAKLHL